MGREKRVENEERREEDELEGKQRQAVSKNWKWGNLKKSRGKISLGRRNGRKRKI